MTKSSSLLAKMIKQRKESAAVYLQGGRPELAENEKAEIVIIREFMPKQMDEGQAKAAIAAVVAELGATSVKDMGKVMARPEGALCRPDGFRPGQRPGERSPDAEIGRRNNPPLQSGFLAREALNPARRRRNALAACTGRDAPSDSPAAPRINLKEKTP